MERVGSYPVRHGTKVDGRLLSELFTQLHFEVMHWLDCTAMVGVSLSVHCGFLYYMFQTI